MLLLDNARRQLQASAQIRYRQKMLPVSPTEISLRGPNSHTKQERALVQNQEPRTVTMVRKLIGSKVGVSSR